MTAKSGFDKPFTWLASYPRSGNTLLRMMLKAGWNLNSTSFYDNDIDSSPVVARLTGHFPLRKEHVGRNHELSIPLGAIVKTHEPCTPQSSPTHDMGNAIYLIRDGRAATASLSAFWSKDSPLMDILLGNRRFGRWGDHALSWRQRYPDIPVIRFEELTSGADIVIETLEAFLGAPQNDPWKPLHERNKIAEADGRYVRKKSDWRENWNAECDEVFWHFHGSAMDAFYPDADRDF